MAESKIITETSLGGNVYAEKEGFEKGCRACPSMDFEHKGHPFVPVSCDLNSLLCDVTNDNIIKLVDSLYDKVVDHLGNGLICRPLMDADQNRKARGLSVREGDEMKVIAQIRGPQWVVVKRKLYGEACMDCIARDGSPLEGRGFEGPNNFGVSCKLVNSVGLVPYDPNVNADELIDQVRKDLTRGLDDDSRTCHGLEMQASFTKLLGRLADRN
ncbi:hypothetical protein KJ632_01540 [Patescibacteria group bacterium]|nr:hypothetical protein [Patescibacteria group bacterium]